MINLNLESTSQFSADSLNHKEEALYFFQSNRKLLKIMLGQKFIIQEQEEKLPKIIMFNLYCPHGLPSKQYKCFDQQFNSDTEKIIQFFNIEQPQEPSNLQVLKTHNYRQTMVYPLRCRSYSNLNAIKLKQKQQIMENVRIQMDKQF
ncbi:hypothetical protein ABPG72_017688 [Tetrahymena utriculariae]